MYRAFPLLLHLYSLERRHIRVRSGDVSMEAAITVRMNSRRLTRNGRKGEKMAQQTKKKKDANHILITK